MLPITVESHSTWDPIKEEFITSEKFTANLEHCLLAISKWESITHKPFLDTKDKTNEELLLYIKCMSVDESLTDEQAIMLISEESSLEQIKKYIEDPMTATTINNVGPKGGTGEFITSELMYYWLVALQIPFTVETWPLQRMLKLVEVCNVKNQPSKKMSKSDILRQNRSLNASRRSKRPKKH